MRTWVLATMIAAGLAAPAAGQRRQQPYVQPEIRPQYQPPLPSGVPATSAVADLTARIDALEAQLARLTGQAEEDANRVRQLEEEVRRYRGEAEERFGRLERPAPAPAGPERESAASDVIAPAEGPPSREDGPAGAALTGDPGEDDYLAGFRLWDQGRFADAAGVLEAMAKKHPKHRRASYARNLAGRAYLDDDKPAAAAKVLLANYQNNPKGERAADSLYFLGQALVRLERPAEACKVYDELQDVYGAGMRDFVRERLPKARADARCG